MLGVRTQLIAFRITPHRAVRLIVGVDEQNIGTIDGLRRVLVQPMPIAQTEAIKSVRTSDFIIAYAPDLPIVFAWLERYRASVPREGFAERLVAVVGNGMSPSSDPPGPIIQSS